MTEQLPLMPGLRWMTNGTVDQLRTASDVTQVFRVASTSRPGAGNSGAPVLDNAAQVVSMWTRAETDNRAYCVHLYWACECAPRSPLPTVSPPASMRMPATCGPCRTLAPAVQLLIAPIGPAEGKGRAIVGRLSQQTETHPLYLATCRNLAVDLCVSLRSLDKRLRCYRAGHWPNTLGRDFA